MNIFKKIVGLLAQKSGNTNHKKPDIDKLLNADDINRSIIELDDYLTRLCAYGDKIDLLNEQQKNFYFNQSLEMEINNGGFNQFYFNSAGNFAHETVDALKAIKALKTSAIVLKANNQFPNQRVPKDRFQRQEVLEQIEDEANPIWEDLDRQFYAYEDDLNSLNMAYIRKHKKAFGS